MRFHVFAAALLTLGACSSLPEPSVAPDRAPPLRAFLTAPSPGSPLGFYVSRPAYVALFEVVPGQGVGLLYPGRATGPLDGRAFAGYTSAASISPFGADRYRFAGAMSSVFDAASAGAWDGPHFLFLIASERPLDVEQYGAWGSRLWSTLGSRFYSSNAYDTMEELARRTLPRVEDDGSWTSDLYVYWPMAVSPGPRAGVRVVELTCNGYSFQVPVALLSTATREICAARVERPIADSTSTARPEEPKAREPLPRHIGEAVEERAEEPGHRAQPGERLRAKIASSVQMQGEPDEPSPAERVRLERWGGVPAAVPVDPVNRVGAEARRDGDAPATRAVAEPRVEPANRATPSPQPTVERPAPRGEGPAPASPAPREPSAPAPSEGRPACNPCSLR